MPGEIDSSSLCSLLTVFPEKDSLDAAKPDSNYTPTAEDTDWVASLQATLESNQSKKQTDIQQSLSATVHALLKLKPETAVKSVATQGGGCKTGP